jgi:hypothetical protein
MTLLGKMMTDIPNTIWDPLIKDGKIVIEISNETPVHQCRPD